MRVERAERLAEREDALAIRRRVFVDEQGVPADRELDDHEQAATHFLAYDQGRTVGTARLRSYPEGSSGRTIEDSTARAARGSTRGSNGGSNRESTGGSTGDSTGGSTGDSTGDSTGGSTGDSTGDSTGGSTGDSTGGSTDGDADAVGKVERVAIVPDRRGEGLGRELMAGVEAAAREDGFDELVLDSQVDAVEFYEGLGYDAEGDVFEDAGIPHRRMRKSL